MVQMHSTSPGMAAVNPWRRPTPCSNNRTRAPPRVVNPRLLLFCKHQKRTQVWYWYYNKAYIIRYRIQHIHKTKVRRARRFSRVTRLSVVVFCCFFGGRETVFFGCPVGENTALTHLSLGSNHLTAVDPSTFSERRQSGDRLGTQQGGLFSK